MPMPTLTSRRRLERGAAGGRVLAAMPTLVSGLVYTVAAARGANLTAAKNTIAAPLSPQLGDASLENPKDRIF